MKTIYQEYALLEAKMKDLEAKKEALRIHILADMIEKGEEKKETDVGSFSVTKLKKWVYPSKVEAIKDEYEAAKAQAQSTGDATFEEKMSLRFNQIKI